MEDVKEQKVTELGCVVRRLSSTSFSLHCVCVNVRRNKKKSLELFFFLQVVWSMKRVLFHKSVSKKFVKNIKSSFGLLSSIYSKEYI